MGKTNKQVDYTKKRSRRDPSYTMQLKNLPAKKYKKGTPAVTRLAFECSGGTTRFIDLAQALSIANRRHYSSGCYYYVQSIEYYNEEGTPTKLDVHTIPDTWVSRSAWRRGAAIYHEMNARALERTGGILPKYYDFRPYMSELHRQNGNRNPAFYDVNQDQTSYGATEWQYSQFVSADSDGDLEIDPGSGHAVAVNQEADNFYCHMLGDHIGTPDNWTSIGLIKSYAESRPLQQVYQPNTPSGVSDDVLVNLFDYSSEEQLNDVIDNLEDVNDATPYGQSTYIGAESVVANSVDQRNMQHVARLVTTPGGHGIKDISGGFCAMGGLICIDPIAVGTAYRIVVNLAPGTYHGVYAERI